MGRIYSIPMGFACVAVLVSGCVEGAGNGTSGSGKTATAAAERPAATELIERDIEAPDVFQKTESGLWDGRPSLGGVWVAHPDVRDPERVLVRNNANGKTVIGALFRRERNNPGPRIQVSSDAAAALGLIAGAPTELSVTALRREEKKSVPAAEPEEAVVASAPSSTTDGEETITRAEAAIDEADTQTVAATASAEEDAAPADGKAARTGFLAGLFKPRQPSEPLNATSTETAGAEIGSDVTTAVADTASTPLPAAEPVEVAAVEPTSEIADAPRSKRSGGFLGGLFKPRSGAPLDAVSLASASATSGGTATAGTAVESAAGGIEISSAEAVPVTTAALAPAPQSRLQKPYVQVGLFSEEVNAENAAIAMRQNGVEPTIYEQESAGTTFWRVVAGPASTRSERSSVLKTVKGLGFDDAYAVSR